MNFIKLVLGLFSLIVFFQVLIILNYFKKFGLKVSKCVAGTPLTNISLGVQTLPNPYQLLSTVFPSLSLNRNTLKKLVLRLKSKF